MAAKGNSGVGSWAFILGVIIAVIGGAFGNYLPGLYAAWITLLLVILGLIVGFMNISQKEANDFLIAAIALILVGTLANLAILDTIVPTLGTVVISIVQNIAAFVAPAALVVSLTAVAKLAKPS